MAVVLTKARAHRRTDVPDALRQLPDRRTIGVVPGHAAEPEAGPRVSAEEREDHNGG